jgi:Raf kinase inhibitor-like YbhB/YbcL family protein
MPLDLSSPAFVQGAPIPQEYTCQGEDISPPLHWSGAPPGTQSFILVVADPDAPSHTFYHWGAYDIPAGATGLAAGYGARRPAGQFREAVNGFGKRGYGGPCPPPGDAPHHYRFHLAALSRATLPLKGGARIEELLAAARPYILAEGELVGRFGR